MKELSLEAIEKKYRKTYGGGPALWPRELAFLMEKAKGAGEPLTQDDVLEAVDDSRTLGRLMELLKGVAIALKGPEPELVMHDWSDLPELAAKKTKRLALLEEVMATPATAHHERLEALVQLVVDLMEQVKTLERKVENL